MKIIACENLAYSSIEDMNEMVKSMIDEGWQPFGPMAMTAGIGENGPWELYGMTMVKYDKTASKKP